VSGAHALSAVTGASGGRGASVVRAVTGASGSTGVNAVVPAGTPPQYPVYRPLPIHHFTLHKGTSIGDTISHFLSGAGKFFSHLANLSWGALLLGLLLYAAYLLLRSRALFNALRASYPDQRIRWRDVWGAYMVGYAVNNVFPLGGGNVAQLFLVRAAIPDSSYPTLAAGFSTGVVFDWFMGLLVMAYSFTQGVFPKPPNFSKLPAFDISFFAGNMRFTLFMLTVFGIAFALLFAWLSVRIRAFWDRVKQGFTILTDRRRYRRDMATWQAASWVMRFGSYWALLDAFHIGGSFRNAMLVLGVQVVASVFPFTPGGAGVQQALLLTIFAHAADSSTVAAFSVGQQIATAILSSALGFAALVLIFRFRSFREVMQRGREDRKGATASDEEGTVNPIVAG
jgi:uncharacterized membrane protein YbhN (UPF0104 family)